MKRAKRPVIVYERKGTDGLITFYHHITIHGNRERVRLESLGRHRDRQAGARLLRHDAEAVRLGAVWIRLEGVA